MDRLGEDAGHAAEQFAYHTVQIALAEHLSVEKVVGKWGGASLPLPAPDKLAWPATRRVPCERGTT